MDGFSKIKNEIDGIGFWKYWGLRGCFPKGLSSELSKLLSIPKAPAHKKALIGSFFHELMEVNPFHLKEEDIDPIIEKLIVNYQSKVDVEPRLKNFPPFGDWHDVNKSCDYFYDQYDKLISNRFGAKSGSTFADKMLFSKSGNLKGKPDLVILADNKITLIEYKSGAIFGEDGEVKDSFLAQVHFYAYLIKENNHRLPEKIIVKNLAGEEVNIEPSEFMASKFAQEAEDFFQLIKTSVETIKDCFERAKPTADECRFCRLRSSCRKFQSRQYDFADFDDRFSVRGKVINTENSGKRKKIVVESSHDGREIEIRNLLPEFVPKTVRVSVVVNLLNLRMSEGNGYLEGTKETEVWTEN